MKKCYASIRLMAVAMLFCFFAGARAQTNPVAVDDTIILKKHHTSIINVLQNDYDPENQEIELFYINNSGNGYGYIFMDSSIRYTNTSTHGQDSLKYTIVRENDWEAYATAWIFANVLENELPAFNDDIPTVMAGEVVEFNLYDVASDPDGDFFYVNRIWDPEHGEEVDYTDSTFSFIITENYNGLDSCRVKITEADPDYSFTTYFVFNVEYNPEFPFAISDTNFVYQGDTAYIPVLLNDQDPQNDVLKIYDADDETITEYFDFNDSLIMIVPRATTDTGLYNFYTYSNAELSNPDHISNKAQGFLQILGNPDLPIAVVDSASVMAGFPVEIPVLMNDVDINGDTLRIAHANQANSTGVTAITDSLVYFTPNSTMPGWHRIGYRLEEKHNTAHYAYGHVIVEATPNPNQPIAMNDTITILGGHFTEFNPLLNDTDPDGMPITLDYIFDHNPFTNSQVIGDSIVRLIAANTEVTVNIPYKFYRTDNPAMISNTAFITVQISVDESTLFGVTDTIKSSPGHTGMINVLENDYNPGMDTLILTYVDGANGLNLWKVNDSVVKYTIDFSVSSPLQAIYEFGDIHDSVEAIGQIYLDIREHSHLIDTLDANHIRASFGATGMHFYDPVDGTGIFEVPAESGKNTILQNSLWIGGKSDYAEHVAAETWHLYGNDFWPGPVSEVYGNDDLAKYRMWEINREEIDYHIAHYQDPDYEPIESIATWPGNGNPELGQAEQLAPYFDQNGDGFYDPYDGDVPLIRGDQSLYFIFNDDYDLHTESGGMPMKIEIHGNAYAFDQPDDSALYNTVFLHYDFYNRSDNVYEDTYIGLHDHFDLGFPYDNYVQCDVSRGNAFVYNATEVDGNGEPNAYGPNPPVQGVTILGGPLMACDNLDNPTGGCDESINGLNFDDGIIDNERLGMTAFAYRYQAYAHGYEEPQTATEYYNWLNSKWNDNSKWQYGGDGHLTSGPDCRFIYPGASDPLNWGTNCEFPNGGYNQNGYYWTEETEGHQPGARYGVSITGPFTFAPGDVQSLDVAFVYARDNDTTDQPSAIDIMNQRIDTIRNRVMNGEIICLLSYSVGVAEYNMEHINFPVFPNPANGDLVNIDLRKAGKDGPVYFEISDITGRSISSGSLLSGGIRTVDISGLRPGIYVMSISQGSLQAVQKLIVR